MIAVFITEMVILFEHVIIIIIIIIIIINIHFCSGAGLKRRALEGEGVGNWSRSLA